MPATTVAGPCPRPSTPELPGSAATTVRIPLLMKRASPTISLVGLSFSPIFPSLSLTLSVSLSLHPSLPPSPPSPSLPPTRPLPLFPSHLPLSRSRAPPSSSLPLVSLPSPLRLRMNGRLDVFSFAPPQEFRHPRPVGRIRWGSAEWSHFTKSSAWPAGSAGLRLGLNPSATP